ncbi:MAG: hypothetical protein ACRC4G_00990 [Alphaproteobacteria bacterium]
MMLEKNVVRLSVGAIFKETIYFFKSHFKEVMKISFTQVLFLIVSLVLFFVAFAHTGLELKQIKLHYIRFFILLAGYGILLTSIYFASITVMMLSTSHLTLTGQLEKRFFRKHWKKRHAKIFGYNLLIDGFFVIALGLIIFGALFLTPSSFSAPMQKALVVSLSALGFLSLLYPLARFSLVIPAISIGSPATLGWSWRQMKGNTLRLLFIAAPFFIPSLLGELLLRLEWPQSLEPYLSGFLVVFSILLHIFCSILTTIAIGLVYKEFERKGALLP